MKILQIILLSVFDPISSFISNSFPEKTYRLLNKSIFIQLAIALTITIIIFVMR